MLTNQQLIDLDIDKANVRTVTDRNSFMRGIVIGGLYVNIDSLGNKYFFHVQAVTSYGNFTVKGATKKLSGTMVHNIATNEILDVHVNYSCLGSRYLVTNEGLVISTTNQYYTNDYLVNRMKLVDVIMEYDN
jgi:hypothetical protein